MYLLFFLVDYIYALSIVAYFWLFTFMLQGYLFQFNDR